MPPMSDSTPPEPIKSKTVNLRPVDQARLAALRLSTGIDNDVDIIRFALAETCRMRGVDPETTGGAS